MRLTGWAEEEGRLLGSAELEEYPLPRMAVCGGEFIIETDEAFVRDRYHIMPGVTEGKQVITARPRVPDLPLCEAVETAVSLRAAKDAVTTLSGGVDSSLVAVLASLPCIAVGVSGSHDLAAAEKTAEMLGLSLTVKEIGAEEIRTALAEVVKVIPRITPLDAEIAVTGYFIAQTAKEAGASRVLTGQAADELFGGYARYGRSADLRSDLAADFAGLALQRERDSAVAALFGVWYSLPFMDERVVCASQKLVPEELVCGSLRKTALRTAASKYLPEEIAWRPKKAMQYGSGVSAVIEKIAKREGFRRSGELIEKLAAGKI